MAILELTNITKTFAQKTVVNDVSFSIGEGEIVALLGPNGAGKTTMILMILGLLSPTSGTITIFGERPGHRKVRQKIGVMLQEVTVMDELQVGEIIRMFCSYYEYPYSVEELLAISNLENERKKRATTLSGGQMRRLNFALALAGNPSFVFLDEPTVGMDSMSRKHFWQAMQKIATQGTTLVFTTHYLEEADQFAERILLMNKGKIVADAHPKKLKEILSYQTVSFFSEQREKIKEWNRLPFVKNVTVQNERFHIQTMNADMLIKYMFERNVPFYHLLISDCSLEEVFESVMLKGE